MDKKAMDLKEGIFEGDYMRGTEKKKEVENDVIILKIYYVPFQTQQANKRTQVLRG